MLQNCITYRQLSSAPTKIALFKKCIKVPSEEHGSYSKRSRAVYFLHDNEDIVIDEYPTEQSDAKCNEKPTVSIENYHEEVILKFSQKENANSIFQQQNTQGITIS